MNLWLGLIVVLLTGFAWSVIVCRWNVKDSNLNSLVSNSGDFWSNGRVQDDYDGGPMPCVEHENSADDKTGLWSVTPPVPDNSCCTIDHRVDSSGCTTQDLSDRSDSTTHLPDCSGCTTYHPLDSSGCTTEHPLNSSGFTTEHPLDSSGCTTEHPLDSPSSCPVIERFQQTERFHDLHLAIQTGTLHEDFKAGSKAESIPDLEEQSDASVNFKNVEETLLSIIESIDQPEKLDDKQDGDVKTSSLHKLRCCINLERCSYDLVWKTASRFGMRKSNRFWDVMWFDVGAGTRSKRAFVEQFSKMNGSQLISHFPGFWSLSSKDLLVRNLQRMRRRFPGHYEIFPKSWILPRDGLQLAVYTRSHKKVFLIAKPADGCAGNGIAVTQDVALTGRNVVYQLYVEPFLIDGFKFDFRVYVLMTSCDPLRLYVYKEGLARFATVKYEEPTTSNCRNVFMHLTNSCVNTRNPAFVKDEISGHSRRMTVIFDWLKNNGIDKDEIQNSMDDAIIKTTIAVLPTLRHNYNFHYPFDVHSHRCFEIMGFDVMLDRNLNVHVLEVNPSPSFGSVTHTTFESELKESVLNDAFKMLEGNISMKLKHRSGKKWGKAAWMNALNRLAEWENSHLGNFRKVYPPKPSLAKYYQKFMKKDISLKYNLT